MSEITIFDLLAAKLRLGVEQHNGVRNRVMYLDGKGDARTPEESAELKELMALYYPDDEDAA